MMAYLTEGHTHTGTHACSTYCQLVSDVDPQRKQSHREMIRNKLWRVQQGGRQETDSFERGDDVCECVGQRGREKKRREPEKHMDER